MRELQEQLPHLAEELGEVEERIEDLLPVVRNYVYHPGFGGRFGLKSVTPALVPELSYEGLEVAGGGEVSQQLFRLLLRSEGMTKEEIKTLRRDLMTYCAQDTEALVRLHKALLSLPERG